MNFLKKVVFIPILGLVLAGCGSSNTTVAAAVANERVAKAMGQTAMSGTVNSINLSLGGDLLVDLDHYENTTVVSSVGIEAEADFTFKAKGLSGDDIEASATASGSLVLTEDNEETFNGSLSASAYLSDMWLYFHLTGVGELFAIEEDEVKAKVNVEGMFDLEEFPIPDSVPNSEDFNEMADMMETLLMEVEDVKAVETNGDLVVTYTITVEDIVDVVVAAMTYMDSEVTPSQISEAREEGLAMMNEMLTIRTAKVVVGVSKLGYLNRLDVDVDMDIVSEEYYVSETVMAHEKITIDVLIEFALEINGNVTITPLPNLEDYVDINS